jgi:hypothetical protein
MKKISLVKVFLLLLVISSCTIQATPDNTNSSLGANQKRQSGREPLPEIPNTTFTLFQKEIKDANWEKALEYCSCKVKAKSREYESLEAFCKAVLPIEKIAALSEFQVRGQSSRLGQVICYQHNIELKDPNYRYSLRWGLSILKEEPNWVVDFTTKPLAIWQKHEILKSKVVNQEFPLNYEISRTGFDVRLIPLTQEFFVGKPMLFRVEMKNISNETLGYWHTSVMVNNPMAIEDPNNTIIPYIEGDYQTNAAPEFVEPNETIVLADNYDLRSQYHITTPGRYTVQFRKRPLTPSPSNIVEYDVKPGQLSPSELLVEKLLPVISPAWNFTRKINSADEFAKEQAGEAVSFWLTGKHNRKGENKGINIALNIIIFIGSDSTQVRLRDHLAELELWGQSQWGPVYVKSLNAEQLWPDYQEQLMKVLGVHNSGKLDRADTLPDNSNNND